ncbi:GDSL-type esterase/lipase family protein [Candidatus Omnitrophota bacterium]
MSSSFTPLKKISGRNQKLPLRKKLILATLIVVMTLCLIEMGLRISGYIILKLNLSSSTSTIKDKRGVTILCLGDSYTFGLGTDYHHSYPRQLEKILNERHKEPGFKVYNLGIPGSNSSQLLNKLQGNIDKYDPDLLIILTGRNDSWNFKDVNYHDSSPNRLDSLLHNLNIYKLVKIIKINLASSIAKKMTEAGTSDTETSKKEGQKRIMPSPASNGQVIKGVGFTKQGRYDLARQHLLKALDLDPRNIMAYRHLGTIYREGAEYKLAEKCFEKALFLLGEDADAGLYLELGIVHRLLNKKTLAKEEFKKAIMDTKHMYLAFNELLLAYKYEKDFYDEIENFKKGIKDKEMLDRIDGLITLRKDRGNIYKILQRNIANIDRISRRNNVKIVVQADPNLDDLAEVVREVTKEQGILLVDSRSVFKEKLKLHDRRDFFVEDDHCNAEGYRIMTENIYHILAKEGIIDGFINRN